MQILKLIILFISIYGVLSENKYSKEANKKKKDEVEFRTLKNPFRMKKINMIWVKAQQRLSEPKLKSLFSDLTVHDKEEVTYKRIKSEGRDKDGLKEIELRRKLANIMLSYGLTEHFEDNHKPQKYGEHKSFNEASDDLINKSLFKDKKLNILWEKAEMSGFTSEELSALKEEFQHHQEKIDQYYNLLDDVNSGKKVEYQNAINEEELEKFNEISPEKDPADKDFRDQANLVRDKHKSLKDGYDRLTRITAKGPNNKEFVEPKVQGLWRVAAQANFSSDELASLKAELHHYESRLLKLRHINAEHVSNVDRQRRKMVGDKMDFFDEQQQMIKKHTRKVEKMHADLESKIMARHSEL